MTTNHLYTLQQKIYEPLQPLAANNPLDVLAMVGANANQHLETIVQQSTLLGLAVGTFVLASYQLIHYGVEKGSRKRRKV